MAKIDIFSGFLGAGKTTLIKKLIKEAYSGEKLVLIENEFGDIGIDGGFMKDAGIEVTEMNSGCICCSLVGDFGDALKKVIETYNPERILIEPSGVGKLSDVIKAVENIDSDKIVLNSATTVVDAKKCKMYVKNFGEFFNNQLENAGTIILSHVNSTSESKLEETLNLIKEHNATASIITTDWDELDGKIILYTMEQKNNLEISLDDDTCHICGHKHHDHHHEHDECCHHDHDHHHEHGECCCHDHEHHHHHHADEVFTSFGTQTTKTFTKAKIEEILNKLNDSNTYGTVLRAKGIVKGENEWIHFDYIPSEPDVRVGSADVTGRFCVIGANINEEEIKKLFLE